jgi:hypothetical protein
MTDTNLNLVEIFSKLGQKAVDEQKLTEQFFSITACVLSSSNKPSIGVMSILYTNLNREQAIKKCEELIPIHKNTKIVIRMVPQIIPFFLNPNKNSDIKIVSDNGEVYDVKNNANKFLDKIDQIELNVKKHFEDKLDSKSIAYASQLWWNLFRQNDMFTLHKNKCDEIEKEITNTKKQLEDVEIKPLEAVDYFKAAFGNDDPSTQLFRRWISQTYNL